MILSHPINMYQKTQVSNNLNCAWLPLPFLPLSQPPSHFSGDLQPAHPGCIYSGWRPFLNTCYRLGDITILMLRSTPEANECHKKAAWIASFSNPTLVPLTVLPTLPSTPLFLIFSALSHLLSFHVFFFSAPIQFSHSFTQSGLKCVRGWQALRSWIKKAIWWRGKQRWLQRRREEKWEA